MAGYCRLKPRALRGICLRGASGSAGRGYLNEFWLDAARPGGSCRTPQGGSPRRSPAGAGMMSGNPPARCVRRSQGITAFAPDPGHAPGLLPHFGNGISRRETSLFVRLLSPRASSRRRGGRESSATGPQVGGRRLRDVRPKGSNFRLAPGSEWSVNGCSSIACHGLLPHVSEDRTAADFGPDAFRGPKRSPLLGPSHLPQSDVAVPPGEARLTAPWKQDERGYKRKADCRRRKQSASVGGGDTLDLFSLHHAATLVAVQDVWLMTDHYFASIFCPPICRHA